MSAPSYDLDDGKHECHAPSCLRCLRCIAPKKRPLHQTDSVATDLAIGAEVDYEPDNEEERKSATVRSIKPGEWVEVVDSSDQKVRKVVSGRVWLRRKRARGEAVAPPWLALSMDYLGNDASWADRHTLERSWMLHTGHDRMYYADTADQALIKLIRAFFTDYLFDGRDLDGGGGDLWQWLRGSAVFTGSAIIALAHSWHPFDNRNERGFGWCSGDVDIFTRSFDSTDRAFGVDFRNSCIVKTPTCGSLIRFSGENASRMHKQYFKQVGENLESRKYYPNVPSPVLINVIQIQQAKCGDDGKGRGVGEQLHEWCMTNFDLDLLATTYDGNKLLIGDGSIAARDRLAMLVARYQQDPKKDLRRAIDRCIKYLKRGVCIENIHDIMGTTLDLARSHAHPPAVYSSPSSIMSAMID